MALYHIGSSNEILNVETESSEEAKSCRTFYDISVTKVLKAIPWPFATRKMNLALVEENPNSEWKYSYRYPSDALIIRKIESGIRTDYNSSRIRYIITGDDTAKLIYTDQNQPVCEYTKNVIDTSFYDDEFALCLSYLLASFIAPKFMRGSSDDEIAKLLKLYLGHLNTAQTNALGEETKDIEPESEFIRSRD